MNRNIKNKKIFNIAALLFLSCICLLSAAPATEAVAESEAETLTVGVPEDRTPVFYRDPDTDEIVGIGVELMRAVCKEAGYDAVFEVIKEPTLKDALDNDEYDVLMPFGSAVDSTSGKHSIVSDNLLQTPFTLVTFSNRTLPPISELKVGMLKSLAAGAETVSSLFPGIEICLYDTMADCVHALRIGEVDALLHNSYVWSYVLQKPSFSKLIIHPSAMFSMDFKAGTIDTPQGRKIIKRINKGIAALPDTKRQAIILDYTSRKLYKYTFFDYIYQFGAVLAVFIVVTLIEVKANKDLYNAKKSLEEVSKAKTMFLANMSHEIRTPINSIMGMGELIIRDTKNSKLRQYAFSINSSANSLLCLVNDILDFSRMEAGKLKLRHDVYHLANLLTDVNMMIKERAESKGLVYDVVVDEDTPEELIGDETRLKQVMINLLTNGVKYTNNGFVHLIIWHRKVDDNTADLNITVEDSGIGLKQEEIDRLFKAFERLDEDRNRTIEGTGLGMSIVKQILDAMESSLDIKSEYGKGSKFSFKVRQEVSDWRRIGNYEYSAERVVLNNSSYHPSFVAPDCRILYVDDTEMNLVVLKGLLEHTKVVLDTATSGKAALALLKDTKYDVLLIDHRMPKMDGVELLGCIKGDKDNPNHDSVCIALTANVVEGERKICLNAGFDDYLEKPVNGKRIEEMLLKYLPQDKISQETASFSDNNTGEYPDELVRLEEQGYIDIHDGIEYAGSYDLFLKTLAFFRDSVDAKADEIDQLLSEGNIDEYTVKVHALKSTSKVIGAYDLSEKAAYLERAGIHGDKDSITENHRDMIGLYRGYRGLLSGI